MVFSVARDDPVEMFEIATAEPCDRYAERYPGDVVGDVDGVVVVPQAIAVDVLQEAEEREKSEDERRKTVRSGVDVLDAFERHDTFEGVG